MTHPPSLLFFFLVGLSEIEKSVVKATYDDELTPKEKHCVCKEQIRDTTNERAVRASAANHDRRSLTTALPYSAGPRASPPSAVPLCLPSVLVECTHDYDLVSLFDRRLTMPKWNVVFKTLIVLHRLAIEGHERFMKVTQQHQKQKQRKVIYIPPLPPIVCVCCVSLVIDSSFSPFPPSPSPSLLLFRI